MGALTCFFYYSRYQRPVVVCCTLPDFITARSLNAARAHTFLSFNNSICHHTTSHKQTRDSKVSAFVVIIRFLRELAMQFSMHSVNYRLLPLPIHWRKSCMSLMYLSCLPASSSSLSFDVIFPLSSAAAAAELQARWGGKAPLAAAVVCTKTATNFASMNEWMNSALLRRCRLIRSDTETTGRCCVVVPLPSPPPQGTHQLSHSFVSESNRRAFRRSVGWKLNLRTYLYSLPTCARRGIRQWVLPFVCSQQNYKVASEDQKNTANVHWPGNSAESGIYNLGVDQSVNHPIRCWEMG